MHDITIIFILKLIFTSTQNKMQYHIYQEHNLFNMCITYENLMCKTFIKYEKIGAIFVQYKAYNIKNDNIMHTGTCT